MSHDSEMVEKNTALGGLLPVAEFVNGLAGLLVGQPVFGWFNWLVQPTSWLYPKKPHLKTMTKPP